MSVKIPQRNLSGTPQDHSKEIYKLKFMRGTLMDSQLLSFSRPLPLNLAIERAQRYCKESNKRFVFLEEGITTLEVEDDGGFIE